MVESDAHFERADQAVGLLPLDLRRLTDPDLFERGDQYALWRRLRDNDHVAWTSEPDGPGFWLVTRYDDGVRVLKDAALFSAARGTLLDANHWEDDPAAGKMLALMDPPRHTDVRHVLAPFFTQRGIAVIEAKTFGYVRALVRHGSGLGEFDFAEEIAAQLPINVTLDILDIPRSDWDLLAGMIDTPAEFRDGAISNGEMLMYFSELAARRRTRPGNDPLSALLTSEVDGRRLTDEEAILSFANVFMAGLYTTLLAAAGGLDVLLHQPEHWATLHDNPELIPIAVEEMLRWTSPVQVFYRTALADVNVGGRTIRRHERVAVWLPSLNRDERVFTEPEVFELARTPNRHVAFGAGAHTCLGALLARLELRLLFREMLEKWKGVVSAGRARRIQAINLEGVNRLPVSVVAA